MIVKVHMLAFGAEGQIREVTIPEGMKEDDLETVFHFGQNEVQPQKCPSVSCGDVIELNGEFHMVARIGFRKITEDELKKYREIPRIDRMLSELLGNID
jgi:hypothetical protein